MNPSETDRHLAFAHRLADLARDILARHFRTPLAVEIKADRSPVTPADRETETAIRDLIRRTYPAHGIYGEEFGADRTEASHVWVVDPLDGTRAFVTGKPMFGTLVALLRDGVPTIGIVEAPATGERWVGCLGRPTTFNGSPARTRPCPALAGAIANATTPDMFTGDDLARFRRLRAAVGLFNYGGDCYAYGLLASGFIDLVIEAQLKPYDYCALVPVIAGAGGIATDWEGRPLRLGSDGRMLAAGDPARHAEALALLAG